MPIMTVSESDVSIICLSRSRSDSASALTGTTLILPPTSTVIEPLSGRIVPQSGADLDKIGVLFSDYLQAKNISLNAKGVSVVPTGSNTPVSWLSTAFKTLDLPVTLMGQKFTV